MKHVPSVVVSHSATPFSSFPSQKAYYSWKRLWGRRWHIRGNASWERGRGPRASSALCVGPDFPFTVRMSHSGFHLLFASSRHRLTADVLTTASFRARCSFDWWTLRRVEGRGEILTACQIRLCRLARCPRVEWPVCGDQLSGCCFNAFQGFLYRIAGGKSPQIQKYINSISEANHFVLSFKSKRSYDKKNTD